MAYLYILKLCNDKYYIGSTNKLGRRIAEHMSGDSPFTSHYLPIKLVFSQFFTSGKQAKLAENWLKKQKNHSFIDRLIDEGCLKKIFK